MFIKHQPVLVLQCLSNIDLDQFCNTSYFFGCSSLSHFCDATKHQPVPALQHLICSRPIPVLQHLLIISMSHFCSIDAHQAYTGFVYLQNISLPSFAYISRHWLALLYRQMYKSYDPLLQGFVTESPVRS